MKQNTILLAGLGVLSACASKSGPESKSDSDLVKAKPNVLFIAVDDMRDWAGYSSNFSNIKTPNLDKLAAQSMVFEKAYCAAPMCCASRTAIMTGKSPANTGVYENGNRWEGDLRTHVTLSRQFMNEGYYVAGFGKIYHGSGDLQYWHHYDLVGKWYQCPDNPDHPNACGNPFDYPDSLDHDWQRATAAIDLINRDIQNPLFLACGFVLPHLPWNAPRRFFNMYPLDSIELPPVKADDLDDIPHIGRKIAEKKMQDHYCKDLQWSHQEIQDSGLWKINIQAYLASISYIDEQLGRLVDTWNEKYGDNGVIVLWGDHGWHLGEKNHWSKFTLWEEGTRTPFMIKVPGVTSPGDKCGTPVSLLDIFPTLIDVCNLSPRNDLDGLSLSPLLHDPKIPWDRGAVTIYGQNNVTVRSKDWRYIHYCDESKELYYHPDDPNEWTNLAGPDYMKIINKHHQWVPKCVPPTKIKNSFFVRENLTCD